MSSLARAVRSQIAEDRSGDPQPVFNGFSGMIPDRPAVRISRTEVAPSAKSSAMAACISTDSPAGTASRSANPNIDKQIYHISSIVTSRWYSASTGNSVLDTVYAAWYLQSAATGSETP